MRYVAFAVLALAATTALAQPPRYTVTVVAENRRYPDFYAQALNDAGQVAGWSDLGDRSRASRWTDGRLEHLEGFGATTSAYGINRNGHVAGFAVDVSDNAKAALWSKRGFQSLGTLEGGRYAHGRDVNDSGRVVGFSETSQWGVERGFLYRDGRMIDLGSVGVGIYSEAMKVNNHDVVIGNERTREGGQTSGWIWDDRGGIRLLFTDGLAIAGDINDQGQVVGSRLGRAFRWKDGDTAFFGNGDFHAINNRGVMVGSVTGGIDIWFDDVGYSMRTLIDGENPFRLGRLLDVNDSGQVLAEAYLPGQNIAGYIRLDPVPEPATLLALGAGLARLTRRRRRLR